MTKWDGKTDTMVSELKIESYIRCFQRICQWNPRELWTEKPKLPTRNSLSLPAQKLRENELCGLYRKNRRESRDKTLMYRVRKTKGARPRVRSGHKKIGSKGRERRLARAGTKQMKRESQGHGRKHFNYTMLYYAIYYLYMSFLGCYLMFTYAPWRPWFVTLLYRSSLVCYFN